MHRLCHIAPGFFTALMLTVIGACASKTMRGQGGLRQTSVVIFDAQLPPCRHVEPKRLGHGFRMPKATRNKMLVGLDPDAGLRARVERTIDVLWQTVGTLIPAFAPSECANCFAVAGCEPE